MTASVTNPNTIHRNTSSSSRSSDGNRSYSGLPSPARTVARRLRSHTIPPPMASAYAPKASQAKKTWTASQFDLSEASSGVSTGLRIAPYPMSRKASGSVATAITCSARCRQATASVNATMNQPPNNPFS